MFLINSPPSQNCSELGIQIKSSFILCKLLDDNFVKTISLNESLLKIKHYNTFKNANHKYNSILQQLKLNCLDQFQLK